MQSEKIISKLNSKFAFVRKMALKELKGREAYDHLLVPDKNLHEINLNVHTDFSFSPYSPTMAAYMAYKSGVRIASVCDYGTQYASDEFALACEKLGIASFPSFEVTLSEETKESVCAIYSVSAKAMQAFNPLLISFREVCQERAKKVCEKINKKLRKYDMSINFESDVLKYVKKRKGATLTLKHVYMAAGKMLVQKFGRGRTLAEFLRTTLCLDIQEIEYNLLCDANNPFYEYDLISALRQNFNGVEAGLTPPSFSDYYEIASKYGCALAYEYVASDNWLRNQTESEKTFSDFEKVVERVKEIGFNTVCLASQNLSDEMIVRFVNLLEKKEMLAIFTEKTQYPRDNFASNAPVGAREYLEKCAYALVGNSISMNINDKDGLFTQKSKEQCPEFSNRLLMFAQIGKNKNNYEG